MTNPCRPASLCRLVFTGLAAALAALPGHAANEPTPPSISDRSVVWQFATGREVTAAPIVDRGVVYCGSTGYALYALDARTGALRWKYDAPFPISARAAVQGETVCLESGDQLIALNRADGKELWRFVAKSFRPIYSMDLTDYHRSSPVIVDNLVYYGDDWGNINGVDLATGKPVFQFTTESGRPIRSTPAVDRGRLFFGDWEGDVYAVSLADKKLLWKHRPPNNRQYYGAVVSEFKVHEGVVYFGSQHDVFAPLDAATGQPVWSYDAPNHTYLPATPLITGNKVIIATTIFADSVIRLDHGAVDWSFKGEGIFFTSPATSGPLLFINSSSFGGTGHLYALEIETGRLVRKIAIEKATASAPAIADGLLYIGAGDGAIYALSIEKLTAPQAP